MTPKSTPRTTLTRIVTTMLVASALSATAAHAASFQYRHPVVGLVSSPTAQAQQVVTEILVALTGGPALPAGEVNLAYSYDLKQLLSVTGDSAYNSSNVSWELQSGQLPAGLSLGTDGVLSGIPTTKDTVGSSFQVLATYKTKTGQQAYTIVVNGAVLHVTQVAAGSSHTCAVTTAGGLKCWGQDTYGQLGNDVAMVNKPTPVDVLGLTLGVVSVSAGTYHTCAVTTTGGLKCWGNDDLGQLGDNATLANKPTPVDVLGLASGVASVSTGHYHTCAVTTSGGLKCWGHDGSGQLGNDVAMVYQPTPVDVLGLTAGVARVSAGQRHTCAITTSGGLKCWGHDSNGQLGDNAALADKPTPVDVLGLTAGVASVALGAAHTCAVTTSGGLKCWGYDYNGQLGNDADMLDKPTPVDVLGLSSGIASVSAGTSHTCAVTTAGGLKCWGRDIEGQLGNDASFAIKATPVDVLGFASGVARVSAGGFHTCAATTAGDLKCWGQDDSGQLGNDASLTKQPTPVDVAP